METTLDIYVLVRASKKTGNIDKVMTAMGCALLQMWALQNTTKSKTCFVINRRTGDVVYATYGTGDFPKVKKDKKGLCKSEEIGIDYEMLQEIGQDDRFDN